MGTWRKEEASLSANTMLAWCLFLTSGSGAVIQRVALLFNLLVNQVFVLEDEIDLSCCRWSLQLLTIQQLFLQLLNGLNET